MMQSEESSSSYYQEQFRQPYDEEPFLVLKEEIKKDKEALEMRCLNKETFHGELFLALKEEIKKDKDALQMRLPIVETKMDANRVANIGTNCINLSK